MSPTNATLLVIDVRQDLNDAPWRPRNDPDAAANIARRIAAWRRTGPPIRHIHHSSRPLASPLFHRAAGPEPKIKAAPALGEPILVEEVNSGFMPAGWPVYPGQHTEPLGLASPAPSPASRSIPDQIGGRLRLLVTLERQRRSGRP